jgi:hypothetical protein
MRRGIDLAVMSEAPAVIHDRIVSERPSGQARGLALTVHTSTR